MLGWSLKLNITKKIVIKQIIFLVTIFLFAFCILPNVAHAQTLNESLGLQQIEDVTMLGNEDIRLTIAKIIRIVLGFLGILVLCLMMYAGYTIMTAAGDAGKVEKGKKILLNAVVGLLIIFSSMAIVQFFIMKLAQATNYLGQGSGAPSGRQSFLGSGSLGGVVKDHYPFRDQNNVPRNTRISVTFNEALDPASVFLDSNGNGTRGDCVNTNSPTFNWNTNCDHLDNTAIQVYALDATGNNTGAPLDMVALASDEGGSFYTVVLRPFQPLGNDSEPVGYSVNLSNNILKEIGGGMFAATREDHYTWIFHTGTEFDLSPPIVVSVYPFVSDTVARNTVLQINFNEPVDPTVAQGRAGTFYHIVLQNMEAGAPAVTGAWRIANGYRTVEFVSDQGCGENSCGQPMFCLPNNCNNTLNPTCSETHNALIRTAALISATSWESVPFSGLTDMSGNSLDGNADGIQDGKPLPIGLATIQSNEINPDNYLWDFEVQNKIDRSAPYVKQIVPPIDAEEITGDAVNSILFSKPMWSSTLGGISITEKRNPINTEPLANLWYRPSASLNLDKTTLVQMGHRVFGPNGEDSYYFTGIDSTVKSLNQNCIYPGRGPYSPVRGSSPVCNCVEDINGALTCDAGCISVTSSADPSQDTGCVQTTNPLAILQGDVTNCLNTMDTVSDWAP